MVGPLDWDEEEDQEEVYKGNTGPLVTRINPIHPIHPHQVLR